MIFLKIKGKLTMIVIISLLLGLALVQPVEARYPGLSFADTVLQQDVTVHARLMASEKLRVKCPTFKVIQVNTVLPQPGIKSLGNGMYKPFGPWQERWTVSGCGTQTTVKMIFIPDKPPLKGTTWHVSP
jgi:hypothetical protein